MSSKYLIFIFDKLIYSGRAIVQLCIERKYAHEAGMMIRYQHQETPSPKDAKPDSKNEAVSKRKRAGLNP